MREASQRVGGFIGFVGPQSGPHPASIYLYYGVCQGEISEYRGLLIGSLLQFVVNAAGL